MRKQYINTIRRLCGNNSFFNWRDWINYNKLKLRKIRIKLYIGVIVTFKSKAEIINVPQIIWILPHISIQELYFLQNLKYTRL